MPAPQNASLPPFLTLTNGYTVRITALDPTNGNTLSSVVISNVALAVDQGDVPEAPPAKPDPVKGTYLYA